MDKWRNADLRNIQYFTSQSSNRNTSTNSTFRRKRTAFLSNIFYSMFIKIDNLQFQHKTQQNIKCESKEFNIVDQKAKIIDKFNNELHKNPKAIMPAKHYISVEEGIQRVTRGSSVSSQLYNLSDSKFFDVSIINLDK